MSPQMTLLGAVLTGGASRRMGQPKALLQHDGVSFVDRAGALLAPVCATVVAIGPAEFGGGLVAVPDLYPGEGPLGGLLSALDACGDEHEAALVVACDLATLTAPTLHRLVCARTGAGNEVVMARTNRLEPLCALWSVTCRSELQRCFDSGERSVLAAAEHLRVSAIDVAPQEMLNVNTPDDLQVVTRK